MAVATEKKELDSTLRDVRAPESSTLVVSDLYKTFMSPAGERIDVLRGLSLEVNAGEVIAITGVSGAGKSTLLNLIGGLDSCDGGKIKLDHVLINRLVGDSLSAFRNTKLGFVFQFHYLLPDLTAAENVALPLMIAGMAQHQALKAAEESLREVGLKDRLDYPVSHLSGGEQQRVAV